MGVGGGGGGSYQLTLSHTSSYTFSSAESDELDIRSDTPSTTLWSVTASCYQGYCLQMSWTSNRPVEEYVLVSFKRETGKLDITKSSSRYVCISNPARCDVHVY